MWLVVLLLIAALGGLFVVWYKVRRIHLMAFGMREQLSVVCRESLALFGQLRAAAYLDRVLALDGPPLPMRAAAASPDFLQLIVNEVGAKKPKVVLDLGSGSSTVVAAHCLQQNGIGHVFSLDHDPHYAGLTRNLLDTHGLTNWATVLDAPLERARWEGTLVFTCEPSRNC